jgi:hypothetical protein
VLSRSDPQPFVHDLVQATRRAAGMLVRRRRRSEAGAPPAVEVVEAVGAVGAGP